MNSTMTRIVAGFIAGALAVIVFHQCMYVAMQYFGLPLRGSPWNLQPDPAAFFGLPRLLNQSFWGGLWGVLFAWMIDLLPGPNWIRGFVFGLIFPWLIGSLLLVPLIKGQALFGGAFGKGGFNILALRTGFLLNAVGFGIGLGVFYPWISSLLARRSYARA